MSEPTKLDIAKSLIVKGDVDAAIQELSLFLNGDFFHDEALMMLGALVQGKGMNGVAAVLTSAAIDARAVTNRPFPEALMNLGAAYKAEHRNDIAAKVWADALAQETIPRARSRIMTNIAGLYINENDPEKAIAWCDRALREDPKNYGAHANRGIACLELGRWREGWAGWSHTYATGDRNLRRYGDLPVWSGTPGLHVIVWGDQGVGDEIYYASCLRDLQRVCRKVTLDCHPRLPALFARSFPEITVHGTRKDLTELEWLRDCDANAAICLADLPGILRNTDDEWSDGAAYLLPDLPSSLGALDKAPRRREPIEGRPYPLRIGLSWTGGTKRTRTDLRSLPIEALEPILKARPDAQWFSLQYTPDAARDVCQLEERTGIRISHFPGYVECFDYDRTASFVGSLDLVITVCTTAHHLGGALGIPTWTLVPSRPSWRYQIKGETLPWYASARLFRQEQDGDWSGPIQRIARELADFR